MLIRQCRLDEREETIYGPTSQPYKSAPQVKTNHYQYCKASRYMFSMSTTFDSRGALPIALT